MWLDLGGFISILLLFPIVFLGSRMASASPVEKTSETRTRAGIVLAFCLLFAAALAPLALLTFLATLFYGIFCAIQIMRQGKGAKRFLIGSVVIVCTLFATADFVAAIGSRGNHAGFNEASAVGTLRMLSSAEAKFSVPPLTGPAKDSPYGTIEDLRKNQLIDDGLQIGKAYRGYVFREALDPARKQFLFLPFQLTFRRPNPNRSGRASFRAARCITTRGNATKRTGQELEALQ
jgi:hypothetical protein